ncbi:hypothetical protein ASPZODRAFT_133725 [Penicilliopsis zonata CBS 506.65]|uniref:Hydrophobin n=1 Tax=Penicilliopsis zonata CBS 506.65 TaxID=1073090 RepID=A0A1L9SF10_9EURO|nr:hypothetical protein ASPZODRAFT_133725 [Penicilliopsis zonata CBS 506.65]OJJ45855.1 hypothetical protein ASPZODRAFT_133725 [Penicilliopsis zonata CBS 506.65]
MKFILAALALAASVVALPSTPSTATNSGNDQGNGSADVRFPIKDNKMTVQQAQTTCGSQASVECCNKATYAGDTTSFDYGLLDGTLSSLIGSGSGAQGLGLFSQCSSLDATVIGADQLLNQKCNQNVVCCQNSGATANNDLVGVAVPCVALGSVL